MVVRAAGDWFPSGLLSHMVLTHPEAQTRCVCVCVQLCLTLCDPMDPQAPLSVEFSRQEYWSALPFPTARDLPDPGIKPASPVSPALPSGFFTT